MPWTFTQEGPLPKTLTLDGWQQPFGRPRQGTIVDIGTEVLASIKRVGGNVDPIVSAYTTKGADWKMHGRWMDRVMGLGTGAALNMALQWKQFVNDRRIVRASWDNLIAYRIFITKMPMPLESANEVVWELEASVITDLSQAGPVVPQPVQTPVDMTSRMQVLAKPVTSPWIDRLGALAWLLDFIPDTAIGLGLLVNAILIPFNLVSQIASQISDFASATQTDLMGLNSGLAQVQTALYNLRQATDTLTATAASTQATYESSPVLGASPIFSGPDMISLQSAKLDSDVANSAMAALMANMRAQVQAYIRGRTVTAYTAVNGDTWESIALAMLGAVDGVGAIRDLNGIQYGQQPVPGTRYQIPAGA